LAKLMIAGAGLATLETVSAKMRIFRVPEFVATAFMLAMLGLLLNYAFEA
jgi:formate hydrogenlyase subunit 4